MTDHRGQSRHVLAVPSDPLSVLLKSTSNNTSKNQDVCRYTLRFSQTVQCDSIALVLAAADRISSVSFSSDLLNASGLKYGIRCSEVVALVGQQEPVDSG